MTNKTRGARRQKLVHAKFRFVNDYRAAFGSRPRGRTAPGHVGSDFSEDDDRRQPLGRFRTAGRSSPSHRRVLASDDSVICATGVADLTLWERQGCMGSRL